MQGIIDSSPLVGNGRPVKLLSARPLDTLRGKDPLTGRESVLSYGHPFKAPLFAGGSLADTTQNTGFRIGGQSPDGTKVDIASVGFGTRLANRLMMYDAIYPKIATVVMTDKLLNREIWLNAVPNMHLWEGPRQVGRISAENLPIVTRPHSNAIAISRSDMMNDQMGLYAPMVDKLADTYPFALDDLLIAMLCAGVAGTSLGTSYDGQNLIDTDHTFRSADAGVSAFQYSNRVNGAFTAAVFQTAWNLFLNLRNEYGRPVHVMNGPMYLLHGPANRIAVRNVLQLDTASIGGFVLPQNLDKMMAIPMCTPLISARTTKVLGTNVTITGNEWFLIPSSSTAVILQIKRAMEAMSVEDGYQVFMEGLYYYGIDAEFGAAYGLPQEIVGGPGT